ncbi:MAG: endo alpha-1,4 polygalactosaminidase [Burkholderiales bacterium]
MNRLAKCLLILTLVATAGTSVVACGGGGSDDALSSADASQEEAVKRRHRRPQASVPTVPLPTPTSGKTRWQPAVSDTWQLQLSSSLDTSYSAAIYVVDLFDTSTQTIGMLRSMGRRVVCYFSAGSSESWRPDFATFNASDMAHPLSGWPGERWLDTRSKNVRHIMTLRLDLARGKGCDGVDPDNVDGYTNKTEFPLDAKTQLEYNRFLAQEAHARGLAIGLKNDVDQLAELEPDFDFAVNEQCAQYDECDGYRVFIGNGKPVLQVEYAAEYQNNTGGARDGLCKAANAANRRALVLPLRLDAGYRLSCD